MLNSKAISKTLFYFVAFMNFIEQIKLAFRTIISTKLRTALTVVIIALGITALVGILTAVEGMKRSISDSFTSMGANSFSIRNREMVVRMGEGGKKPKVFRAITFDEAQQFKSEFQFPATVALSVRVNSIATVEYGDKKTNPNIGLISVDENYLKVSGYEIQYGRGFSIHEVNDGASVVVLGSDVATRLFKKVNQCINEMVTVGSKKYRVIGVLTSKGVSKFLSSDNNAFIPLLNGKRNWSLSSSNSYTITVAANHYQLLEAAVSESQSLFRVVRKTPLADENDFEIMRSDDLANQLISNLQYVTWACVFIAVITLIGAAIGLMNIMLVSINERTREIGIGKAIGATNKIVLQQFLTEAILICQLGGLLGVLFGILLGNMVSNFMGSDFFVPWKWISLGLGVCFTVGLAAGIYPAIIASKLNPINALLHE